MFKVTFVLVIPEIYVPDGIVWPGGSVTLTAGSQQRQASSGAGGSGSQPDGGTPWASTSTKSVKVSRYVVVAECAAGAHLCQGYCVEVSTRAA